MIDIKKLIFLIKNRYFKGLIMIIFLVSLFEIFQFSLPSVTIINQTDMELQVYTPQYRFYIEDGSIIAGCCPTSRDITNMSKLRGKIKSQSKSIYYLNINALKDIYTYAGEDSFMFELNWMNKNNKQLGNIYYQIMNSNDEGICKVTVVVNKEGYIVKESDGQFCIKKLSRIEAVQNSVSRY